MKDVNEASIREQWLAASNAVAAGMLAGEDRDVTLLRVAQQARLAASAPVAAITRPMPRDDTTLSYEVVDADDDTTSLLGLAIPVEGTVTGRAFRTGRSVVVRHYGDQMVAHQRSSPVRLPPLVKDLDSAIAVPLGVAGQPLGALTVARYADAAPFTEADVQLIENFAHHAALVIEFGRARDDRERLNILEDRHRIARDLHDIVIQRLYATGLRLYALSDKITQPENDSRAREIVEDIDDAIQHIRATIFALEEPEPPQGKPRAQLWHLIQQFADVLGFEPWVDFEGPLDTAIPASVCPDLRAAVHEALSNVARHAGATSVYVRVFVDPEGEELNLTVIDNGGGIQDTEARGGGLANLEKRAARWAGSFSTHSEPGCGTKLTWRIVLPR
jgi:signal transduction histidine kinase